MADPQFRRLAHRMVDLVADYLEKVEQYPVLSQALPGALLSALPREAPATGPLVPPGGAGGSCAEEGGNAAADAYFDALAEDIDRLILPGITHWQHPQFYAYFSANTSTPSILAELLSAGLGVQGMLWATSPACTELEQRMLDWLASAIGLPSKFMFSEHNHNSGGGVIAGTASESTLVAMLAARGRVRQRLGEGHGPLVVYASTQAHSSVAKAAMIAGVAKGADDAAAIRLIPTDSECRMSVEALAKAMTQDISNGRVPAFVVATIGTTGVTAVDPLASIGAVVKASGAVPWLHVDAAHSGAACVCPEFRWMFDGIEFADSVCMNPHKWLLTNFDCGCLWLADAGAVTGALSVTPEYLRNQASETGAVVDYRDWQVPLGRRFRSLKLWFVMRAYGVAGLRSYIREHVRLATMFEGWVAGDGRFEVMAKRTVNLVCFRLRSGDGPTRRLMEAVNASGRAYLTHTVMPGDGGPQPLVLRMAISGSTTQQRHVAAAWDLIRALAEPPLGL